VNVESTYEKAYISAAKELGITVVSAILSFDNLTSQPSLLLYDYYLTWNQGMRDQLLRLYPQVKADQVCITGTPQFDFHRRPDCLWSRENTINALGLPHDARYILYGTSVSHYAPAEPELVARLAEKMAQHDLLCEYWLIVRTHPRDDWSRWEPVRKLSGRILLSEAWEMKPDINGWAFPTMKDYARLTSSLYHAQACINIASTITLDAAILDCPVIGIRFDKEPDAPREILYEEYDTDHYRPLVESGGLCMAHTWDELMGLMQQAIKNPERDRSARARMVAQECGLVDGNAAQRVADALLSYMEKIHE
jgi:CDP-glycerol glycerophosphotransferase (TagB/SpsB family)